MRSSALEQSWHWNHHRRVFKILLPGLYPTAQLGLRSQNSRTFPCLILWLSSLPLPSDCCCLSWRHTCTWEGKKMALTWTLVRSCKTENRQLSQEASGCRASHLCPAVSPESSVLPGERRKPNSGGGGGVCQACPRAPHPSTLLSPWSLQTCSQSPQGRNIQIRPGGGHFPVP